MKSSDLAALAGRASTTEPAAAARARRLPAARRRARLLRCLMAAAANRGAGPTLLLGRKPGRDPRHGKSRLGCRPGCPVPRHLRPPQRGYACAPSTPRVVAAAASIRGEWASRRHRPVGWARRLRAGPGRAGTSVPAGLGLYGRRKPHVLAQHRNAAGGGGSGIRGRGGGIRVLGWRAGKAYQDQTYSLAIAEPAFLNRCKKLTRAQPQMRNPGCPRCSSTGRVRAPQSAIRCALQWDGG